MFIDDSLKVAGPSFETLAPHPNGSTFECTIIYSKKAYNPCNSDLMTAANIGLSIAKNIVAGALTLGTGGILTRYDYLVTLNGDSIINDKSITNSETTLYWYDLDKNVICSLSNDFNELSKVKQV